MLLWLSTCLPLYTEALFLQLLGSDALKRRLVALASTGAPLLVRVPGQDCLPGHEPLAVCRATAHSSDGHSQGTRAKVCSVSHLWKRKVLQTEASQSIVLCWAE